MTAGAEPSEPKGSTHRPAPRPSKPRVLLAEDDLKFRHLLSVILECDRYDVHSVPSAFGLLRLLAAEGSQHNVNLVISDERMPGMRGLELFQQVRASGWRGPLLLITAFPDDEVIAQAAELRVAVLTKPFDLDVFSAVAAGLIGADGETEIACASCGSLENLQPLDEAKLVFFCSECRQRCDLSTDEDAEAELGVGD